MTDRNAAFLQTSSSPARVLGQSACLDKQPGACLESYCRPFRPEVNTFVQTDSGAIVLAAVAGMKAHAHQELPLDKQEEYSARGPRSESLKSPARAMY